MATGQRLSFSQYAKQQHSLEARTHDALAQSVPRSHASSSISTSAVIDLTVDTDDTSDDDLPDYEEIAARTPVKSPQVSRREAAPSPTVSSSGILPQPPPTQPSPLVGVAPERRAQTKAREERAKGYLRRKKITNLDLLEPGVWERLRWTDHKEQAKLVRSLRLTQGGTYRFSKDLRKTLRTNGLPRKTTFVAPARLSSSPITPTRPAPAVLPGEAPPPSPSITSTQPEPLPRPPPESSALIPPCPADALADVPAEAPEEASAPSSAPPQVSATVSVLEVASASEPVSWEALYQAPRLSESPELPAAIDKYRSSLAARLQAVRNRNFDSDKLDAAVYIQPSSNPPETLNIPLTAFRATIPLPTFLPRQLPRPQNFIQRTHRPLPAPEQAAKDAEIAARGGRKFWFGKVAARKRWRREKDRNTPPEQRPRVCRRQRDMSFLRIEELPVEVRENPVHMEFLQWLRDDRRRRLSVAVT